jgi:hypothetical protein
MPTPRKSAFSSAGAESPRWPGSPRLQPPASPRVGPYTPPSSSSAAAPAINVQRATPSPRSTNTRTANANSNANANPNPTSRTDHNSNSNTSTNTSTSSKDTNSGNYSHSNSSNSNVSANTYASASAESDVDESQMPSGSRTPARGSPSTLETVREVSLSSSPSTDHGVSLDGFRDRLSSEDSTATVRGSSHLHHPTDIPMLRTRQALLAQSQANESGNESGGAGPSGSTPAERKRTMSTISTGPSPPLLSRQSSALSTKQLKGKEELSKHMTVETETVEVLQQNALLSSTGGAGAHKTLKNKQSSETIRPKREKRKATRKLPAVNPLSGEQRIGPSLVSRISATIATPQRPTKFRQRYQGSRRPASAAPLDLSSSSSSSPSQSPDNVVGQVPLAPGSPPGLPHGLPARCLRRTSSRSLCSIPELPSSRFSFFSLLTNTSTASSKADNFEAKIASAVDEANTSDSEETFVYDSNPPERDDRQRRFHSRTPSATSMVSQGGERVNLRSIYGMIDERPGMASAAKRGNKFLNTLSNNGADSYHDDENGKGSGRSTAGSARGSARHHHLGRWGRNHANNGHTSLFDSDSPFLTTASRSKLGSSSSQGARRSPAGPPSPHHHRVMHNGKRSLMQFPPSTYDLDEAAPADDERTPLIHGSVRSSRSSRSRRPNSRSHPSMRHIESQSFRQRQSCLNRFAACLVVTIMLFLGITGAIGFMFATSQPMTDIELRAIKNVLASEPELMFDLTLKAHNPNIVVVTIDQADLEIFAKSIHAGTDGEWSQFPEVPAPPDPAPGFGALDDPPYDTPDDDSAPNMKLGTINEFDSPLSFEGSFFHHGWSESTGEVRLHAPGNFTNGGSTRWGRILENEFDLIVKGVVRYTLPFSNHIKSASISGRTTVKPNSANDPSLRPNTTIPDA